MKEKPLFLTLFMHVFFGSFFHRRKLLTDAEEATLYFAKFHAVAPPLKALMQELETRQYRRELVELLTDCHKVSVSLFRQSFLFLSLSHSFHLVVFMFLALFPHFVSLFSHWEKQSTFFVC
jgi:hypothetical protein